jgi:Protein of unknown function DUF262
MSVLDDVEKHRNDIVTDGYTVTWRELIGQYKDKELIINPEYQRLFRWDIDQQTQYIESILLNIPSPPLFLARNDDAVFEVIDGLQRISTLLKFFASEIVGNLPADDKEVDETENDISRPSILTEGRIVQSLEGFTATTLPESLVRIIRYARIPIILLEKGSNKRARYEVFRRLNRFGSLLSDQEIRNCTARLLGKEFPDQLRNLAENPLVRAVLGLSEDAQRRMGADEAILRLLALNFSQTPLKHQIREYLDDFMEFAAEGKFKLTPDITARLEKSFALIHEAIPDGSAFRLRNQGFSTNLFDVVATGVLDNLDSLDTAKLKRRFEALLDSAELKGLIGAGSNTRKKLQGRIDLGKSWFAR